MTNGNLGEMLRALDTDLVNALKKSRAAFRHSGTQGADAESAVRSLLDLHLPRYLTVGTGEVIDQADARSGQIDVVIANEDQPFRNGLHDPGVFLIEGISAVGEVKSRLTAKNLDEAINNAAKFKRLRSNDEPYSMYVSHGSDDGRFHQSRPYFLFAFESSLSVKTLLDRLKSAKITQWPNAAEGQPGAIDAVFVLGKGVAIDYNDGGGALRYVENEETVTGWHWHSTTDSVIIYLLLWLNVTMPRYVKLAPIASDYLFRLAEGTRELPQGAPRIEDLVRFVGYCDKAEKYS